MPNRYRLKGASLEEIRSKAEAQYGPAARIISAERVSSPGIAGLFAANRYEAVVELQPRHDVVTGEVIPDADIMAAGEPPAGSKAPAAPAAPAEPGEKPRPAPAARPHTAPEAQPRTAPAQRVASAPGHALQGGAIAALLAEADAAELTLHRSDQPALSTETPGFAELLDQLGAGLRPAAAGAAEPVQVPAGPQDADRESPAASAEPSAPVGTPVGTPAGAASGRPAARRTVPAPLSGTGDLVVLVGLGDDPLDTALAMSLAAGGADVRTSGELSAYGHLHLDGRQSATAARAHAVETEQTVLAAFGLGKARNTLARLQAVTALSPDQVWAVVDAGRKPEDTARWVSLLLARVEIAAVAVVGAADTATPESVEALGLPVGWIDGRPATGPAPWTAPSDREG